MKNSHLTNPLLPAAFLIISNRPSALAAGHQEGSIGIASISASEIVKHAKKGNSWQVHH
ncbi:MAG: hypothetical protein ACU837_10805 [Gammaproteobacteria bacterium]